MVKIVFLLGVLRRAVEVAVHAMELHVHQACGVVGPLQERPQTHEIQRFVHQHGAHAHAARKMGVELHPLEELTRVTLERACLEIAPHLEPGLILGFPYLGRQCSTHGTRIFARRTQARNDAGRIALVLDHELHDVARPDIAVFFGIGRHQFADADHALPAHQGHVIGLG